MQGCVGDSKSIQWQWKGVGAGAPNRARQGRWQDKSVPSLAPNDGAGSVSPVDVAQITFASEDNDKGDM